MLNQFENVALKESSNSLSDQNISTFGTCAISHWHTRFPGKDKDELYISYIAKVSIGVLLEFNN